MQPTSLKDLEAILGRLDSKKDEWANLSTLKRADILRKTLRCVIQVRDLCRQHPMLAKARAKELPSCWTPRGCLPWLVGIDHQLTLL